MKIFLSIFFFFQAVNVFAFEPKCFLQAIKQIESTGGIYKNHKPIVSGLHANTAAIGVFGLMPVTIKWLASYNKDVTVNQWDLETIVLQFEKSPDLQYKYAHKYLNFLIKIVGKEPSRLAYAWLNGPNKEPVDLENHYYVKRFHAYYGMQSLNCDS